MPFRSILLVLSLLAIPRLGWSQAACPRPAAGAMLDHVIVVVPDLDSARAHLAPLGFRFKAGRLHPNGLLNLHLKFRDGSELELMSLAGPPGDASARDYARLLRAGAGGAYVALRAQDLTAVAQVADRLALSYRRTQAGGWQFLGFPPPSPLSAVFFGTGWSAPADPDSVLTHPNGAQGLREAWVQGGAPLERLLQALGALPCDTVQLADGRRGRRWALASGALVVLPPPAGTIPRPVGALPGTMGLSEPPPPVQVFPGFWIGFTSGRLAPAN